MCDYQRGTIECYNGDLFDADSGYHPDWTMSPCPKCNTKEYLLYAKEEAESTSYYSDMYGSGTGCDIWVGAVDSVRKWNKDAADVALREIGRVDTLIDDDADPDGFRVYTFNYGTS